MTCKTFVNSTFHIDFDMNYKSFPGDRLGLDEKRDGDQNPGVTSLTVGLRKHR